MKPWHALSAQEAFGRLAARVPGGLEPDEARRRLEEFGRNSLPEKGSRKPWLILAAQMKSTMALLLAAAIPLSFMLGDAADAAAVAAILALNAALGFFVEYRAEGALAALKKRAAPTATVRRGGRLVEIPAEELVRGDLMVLEAGGRVPADGRLLEAAALTVDESSLTGESQPAEKDARALPDGDVPLGDRLNMVYLGTTVVRGRGLAAVTETGLATEMGRIAEALQKVSPGPTPLQDRLERLSRVLAGAAAAVVAVVFALGLLRGEPFRPMLLAAISLAVAAIPEGLPAVVAAALALAARRMLARQALVRRLTAAETLGSVTVICADKTGTLTQNRMTLAALEAAGRRLDFAPESPPSLAEEPAAALLLAAGALCSDASLESSRGDPTETAWVAAAAAAGLPKPALERQFPRIDELPFDSERKRMATLHLAADGQGPFPAWRGLLAPAGTAEVVFAKGSAESLLGVCTRVLGAQGEEPLTADRRREILEDEAALARRGLRALGAACRAIPAGSGGRAGGLERELVFIGLAGLVDPPRPQAAEAVRVCRAAGIRPVMITGDHPATALSVARQVGIDAGGRTLAGPELSALSREELGRAVGEVSVYARVSPEHKLRIVSALKERGCVVAMTGDGVNDAPALKKADIGVAMGLSGTDVAREAASMVLLDDDFATIVAAVREGRAVYDNIRKFVRYLVATNTAELWLMLLAPFLGMPLPLLPLQILWINLVTDGLPALALAFEPPEPDVMSRPPRDPQERLFDKGMIRHIVWLGLLMAGLSLAPGYASWRAGSAAWRTLIMTTLTFTQMANVLAIRSERRSVFGLGWRANPAMLAAVGVTVLSQLAIVYWGALQPAFRTVPLSAGELGLSIGLSAAIFAAVEMEKRAIRFAPGKAREIEGDGS